MWNKFLMRSICERGHCLTETEKRARQLTPDVRTNLYCIWRKKSLGSYGAYIIFCVSTISNRIYRILITFLDATITYLIRCYKPRVFSFFRVCEWRTVLFIVYWLRVENGNEDSRSEVVIIADDYEKYEKNLTFNVALRNEEPF